MELFFWEGLGKLCHSKHTTRLARGKCLYVSLCIGGGVSLSFPPSLHSNLLYPNAKGKEILHLQECHLSTDFSPSTVRQPLLRLAGVNSLCLTADEGMQDLWLIWVPIHHPRCRLLMMALPKDKEVWDAQYGPWWQARDKCLCWVNWFEWL